MSRIAVNKGSVSLSGDSKFSTSNSRLDYHCEKLVIFVQWIADWVLLANHQTRRGDEKVGVYNRDMAKEANITVDDEYECAPLPHLQW